jgi:hypothetical protein
MNPADENAESPEKAMSMNMEQMQKNMRQIELVRIVLYMVLGAICGICGLTGLNGFLFYTAASGVITVAMAAQMKFQSKMYMNETMGQLLLSCMTGQFMSFVTFWTLSYSLVYVY